MSKTDETRISLLENNHQQTMEKFDDIITRFDKFEEKLDKALEKKANVWVETAFTWVLYSMGGIVLTALMYLIINK